MTSTPPSTVTGAPVSTLFDIRIYYGVHPKNNLLFSFCHPIVLFVALANGIVNFVLTPCPLHSHCAVSCPTVKWVKPNKIWKQSIYPPLGGRSHASLASRRTGGQEVAMAPLATRAGNEGTRSLHNNGVGPSSGWKRQIVLSHLRPF